MPHLLRRIPAGLALSLALSGFVLGLTLGLPRAAVSQEQASQEQASPAAVLADLVTARLAGDARRVDGVVLDTGFAVLALDEGLLFPRRTAAGRTTELVFMGRGRLTVEPPDAVEAAQLELFTGSTLLEERFDQAVLVLGRDAALAGLLERPVVDRPEPEALEAARRRAVAWDASRERRLAGATAGLALDPLGDSVHETFFAAWIDGARFGELLLFVRPDEVEPLTLGRFVPFRTDGADSRALDRRIRREQRQGRWLGLTLEDLGSWDTWLSARLPAPAAPRTAPATATAGQGTTMPEPTDDDTPCELPARAAEAPSSAGVAGGPAVAAVHYELSVDARPRRGDLEGRGRIEVRALSDGRRAVRLALHRDLALDSLRLSGTSTERDLPFLRDGGEIVAFLPAPTRRGETLSLEIAWSGRFFESTAIGIGLRDPLLWQPHAGLRDRATYDVTIRYPRSLELLASGTVVSRSEEGRRRIERRRIDRPGRGFGFSIGDYRIQTARVRTERGDVQVRLGLDPAYLERVARVGVDGRLLLHSSEILDAVASSLAFYEEIFGPYPFSRLEAASVPGEVSRALPGFVSLSQVMLLSRGEAASLLGLEDRRTVIAHEVAHQWWGHLVGWRDDRDQWISEAMASYAALRWARRYEAAELGPGPTDGWQDELLRPLPDGRPLESVGPLVLGGRLESTRAPGAYQAIVYRKGAVVLDMLARHLGDERFSQLLGTISREASAREPPGVILSTGALLSRLEELSGESLRDFACRYVYGTGVPEILYDWTARQLQPGEAALDEAGDRASDGVTRGATELWRITLRAELAVNPHARPTVVARPDLGPGIFDVPLASDPPSSTAPPPREPADLRVPLRIVLARDGGAIPERVPPSALPPGVDLRTALLGTLRLDGATTERTIDIEGRPATVELDPEQQVLARFVDARSHPKQVALRRARTLIARGETADAEALLRSALELRTPRGRGDEAELAAEIDALTDALVELTLADLALDRPSSAAQQSRVDEIRRGLDRALDAVPGERRNLVEPQHGVVRSRLALLSGRADEAFETLDDLLIDDAVIDDLRTWLLYAAAARAVGDDEAFERARVTAISHGAGVGPLER